MQKVRADLSTQKSEPLCLFIQDDSMMTNQSGAGGLPPVFRILVMDIAYQYSPYLSVYTSKKIVKDVTNGRVKEENIYDVEGAITAYDQDEHTISTGIDFGVDFGEGSKETTSENRYRNTDKISSLEITVFLKHNGKICASSSAEIKISNVNRGYSFGLRINDSGLGMNSYHTKSDGIGKSLRKLLTFIFADLIEQVIDQRRTISNHLVTGAGTDQGLYQKIRG